MKNLQQATHNHKRAGAVMVIERTSELAKVLIPASGDEFWVKLADLTELGTTVAVPAKTKKPKANRPNASANSRYRVVRVA
jgi:hypothetical protein